jgi:cytoskeletal protein CcmA (bactofilin family)
MKKSSAITTFLGADAFFEGVISFEGTIRLDGKVNGEIKSESGTLIVGEKAEVNADIHVGVAKILGKVKGTVVASERIEAYEPSHIIGDIKAPVISINKGVLFNGNCIMTSQNITDDNVTDMLENDKSMKSVQI